MVSGMSEMLCTIFEMIPARFIGSSPASSNNNWVLNRIKSVSCDFIYWVNDSALWLLEKESGSSPSGSKTTLMLSPS